MERQEIIDRMIEASKEDRDRFFAVADTLHLQPKYKDNLDELERIKQQWRDMTTLQNYPEIKWPLELPEWFPMVKFASNWNENYVDMILEQSKSFKNNEE